jgi:uncharacterized damage-inducible protein DinB
MARLAAVSPSDFVREILETYAVNDRMNQVVLEHLDARAWRAATSGRGGRTIAAIFAHVHNVRCKWLRLSARHLKRPPQLHRATCTQSQARTALEESAERCGEMISQALTGAKGQSQNFLRDGWAQPGDRELPW